MGGNGYSQGESMNRAPKPVRLVVSCLAGHEEIRIKALKRLIKSFGALDWYSEPMAFDQSAYYEPEMGGSLNRRLAAFETLVMPHELAAIKRSCEDIEKEFSINDRRRVNLDPGLLSEHSLILATHKTAPHRIALTPDCNAELTLLFREGGYQALPWTYPDYAGDRLKEIFFHLRDRYLWQLKNMTL